MNNTMKKKIIINLYKNSFKVNLIEEGDCRGKSREIKGNQRLTKSMAT